VGELGPDTVEIGHAVHLIVFFGLWISTKALEPVESTQRNARFRKAISAALVIAYY
jgi:hypothetical protein